MVVPRPAGISHRCPGLTSAAICYFPKADVRIRFHKHSDDRHGLELIWNDGGREQVDCESRSYLLHDFLHYAVESAAGIQYGFWGSLAAGGSLAAMSTPEARAAAMSAPGLGEVEKVVGALHQLTKGAQPDEVITGIARYYASSDLTMPPWLDGSLVSAASEILRHVRGRWRATPYGAAMELPWPGGRNS